MELGNPGRPAESCRHLQELLDLYALDLAGAVDWSDSGEEPELSS